MRVMMLLSSYSLVSDSMPNKLSISTMSIREERAIKKTVTLCLSLLTLKRNRQVGQLPDFALVVVEDFVLTVVLDHVLTDELVIDDCGTHRLLVLLNFLLVFELVLNLGLHG